MASPHDRKVAFRFIVCIGIVSLFADMTYEGAYSGIGSFLEDLGLSAAAVAIISGLGEAKPSNIVVMPVLFEGDVKAGIELASFYRFSDIHLTVLNKLT